MVRPNWSYRFGLTKWGANHSFGFGGEAIVSNPDLIPGGARPSPLRQPPPAMKSTSLSDHISAQLREDILRGRYRSGERLPSERDLAQRFEVHRGAVREALKKLEQLGLADIQAGGARVNPVEEASLDVVKHLLELDDPPDHRVVEQILEAFGGMMSLSLRLCVERANTSQRERALELLEKLAENKISESTEFELFQELGDLVTQASGNPVLMLVHKGLGTRFLGKLQQQEDLLSSGHSDRIPIVEELKRAMENRDGPATTEAGYRLGASIRKSAAKVLTSRSDADLKESGTAS